MPHTYISLKSKWRSRLESGVAAVEFVIVLIPLLLIVAGIVEFGKVIWYYDALTKATRDGARLMSMADKETIEDAKNNAQTLVINTVKDARVSPDLTSGDEGNVRAECLSADYKPQSCTNGTAPINVRVRIVNFNVDLGEWIPFISNTNDGIDTIDWNDISLSPSTTMRYMCTGSEPC